MADLGAREVGLRPPLAGIRVVAVEQAVSAPLCTRHLADLGAAVIKVERPEGDFARRYDSAVMGLSAYFVWLNYGKESVPLDLGQAADRTEFERLLAGADVFVHNLGPGAIERLGYGWASVQVAYPGLIMCEISGYGRGGPYEGNKAFDLLVQAESGLLSVTGTPDQPARVGISIADISSGMYALSSILACLADRSRQGDGRHIEISMLESLAEWMTVPALYEMYTGSAPARTGLHHSTIAPYGPFPTGEGQMVIVAVQNERQWEAFCSVALQQPALAADDRFRTNERRVEHRTVLSGLITRSFEKLRRAEVEERLSRADVPYAYLNSVADLVRHPQLAARDRWQEVATPVGPVRTFRPPFNIDGVSMSAAAVPELEAPR